MFADGPAVCFSRRNPTTAPPQICPGRLENCHGARRLWRTFCRLLAFVVPITRDEGGRVQIVLRGDARFAHRSGAKVGVRVQEPLQNCLECRSKSKNRDEFINATVRVMRSAFLFHENL